ncbi:hypothetical protein [Brevibacterium luteolum]|nr:hypothetical protein [Brevibacterium luteolum]MCT1829049.1 hypothetical protein [Brevibacterium luteolum]
MPTDWPTFIHKDAAMQAYGLPGGRDGAYTDTSGTARLAPSSLSSTAGR